MTVANKPCTPARSKIHEAAFRRGVTPLSALSHSERNAKKSTGSSERSSPLRTSGLHKQTGPYSTYSVFWELDRVMQLLRSNADIWEAIRATTMPTARQVTVVRRLTVTYTVIRKCGASCHLKVDEMAIPRVARKNIKKLGQ